MKFTLLLTLLSFTTFSYGMSLNCVSDIPTTSVVGKVEGDEFVVHVIHHFGSKYMPIVAGVVTPDDLPALTAKAELFKKLGDHYVFRFNMDNCKRLDQDIMSCAAGDEVEMNGVKVKPWSLYTKRIRTEFDIADYEQTAVDFNMNIKDKLYHLSFEYSRQECDQSAKAQEILKRFRK